MKGGGFRMERQRLLILCAICLVAAGMVLPSAAAGEEIAPLTSLGADFTANATGGTAPLAVQFTDLSTGNPDHWNWSFGDGSFSEEQNPVHTYLEPGTYPVSLTVSTEDGTSDTATRTNYLEVTALPETPTQEPTTQVPTTPEPTTLLPSPSPFIQSLDPGSMAAGSPGFTLHVYGTGFTENSKVQWNGEEKATTYVSSNEIDAEIAASDISGLSGMPVTIRVYDYKGGGLSDSRNFLITAGVQTPELTATPSTPLAADFDTNLTGAVAPVAIQFTDFSTGEPDRWNWSFGDGIFSEEQNPVHTYESVGSYTVQLTIWNTSRSATDTVERTFWLTEPPSLEPPVADFEASPLNGRPPLYVVIWDLSTGEPDRWNWSFGDGTFADGISLEGMEIGHEYSSPGLYTVSLTVWNQYGSSVAVKENYINVTEYHVPPKVEEYCPVAAWGSKGTQNGQFKNPDGVAADSSGNVYVADGGNGRIQKFDWAGNFLIAWGSKLSYGSQGFWPGWFHSPAAVAVDPEGNVYVLDRDAYWGGGVVQKFDGNGNFLAMWGSRGSGDGQFWEPTDIAVDLDGNVYVTDYDRMDIQKFDSSGTFLASLKSGEWGIKGIDIDSDGNLYVTDSWNDHIQKFGPAGNLLSSWGSSGVEYGLFSNPSGISLDSSGKIYVTDTGNNRIQKFDPAGTFLTSWGSKGSGFGEFDTPLSVAVDPMGDVSVADLNNNRIQKFSPCTQTSSGLEPPFPVTGGTFTRIAQGTDFKDNPAIDGDRVVWTENNDIYLYDLLSGTERQITTDPSSQDYARISGDRVVYRDGRKGYWHVFLSDLSTGQEQPIGTGTISELSADISGDNIVWKDERNHKNELWSYNLATKVERKIAPDAVNPDQPAISGSRVVYTDVRNGNTDIYLYDLNTGGETRITSDPGFSVYPDISGDTIVWGDTRNTNMNIYAYNIATKTETRLSSAKGAEQFPRISGNLVTWQWTSPSAIRNIVLYDMRNMTAFQITPNEGEKGNPDISGNRVSWRHSWGGNNSILVFTWDGNPVKYLVADLHAKIQSIPALEPLIFNDTSYGLAPTHWSWNFGDGTTSTLQNPVHTYRNPGTYTVSLTVWNDARMIDTTVKNNYIQVTEPLTTVPVPDFSATLTYGVEPLQVTFNDQSSGYPSAWLWDFGDGTTSPEQSLAHMYTSAGVYSVSLTASNHIGTNTTVKGGYITVVSTTPPPPPPPPFPTVTDLSPVSILAGSPGFTLHVYGTNFTEKSVVFWNFKERNTTLISGTVVRADIPASDVSHSSKDPMDVRIYTYDGGLSNAGAFYITGVMPTPTPTPTPKPTPQPGALSLTVTPEQHWVQPYQLLRYDIDVFQDGHLVPADIEVKLDGKSIASFRASHYTYEFYPPSVDEHYLEIIARDGNRRATPDPWTQKILTYGTITPALLMADAMHTAADNEIVKGETLAAEKSVDFVTTTSSKVDSATLDLMLGFGFGDEMKDAVWAWWPGLARESPEFFRVSSTLIMLREYFSTYIPGLIVRAAALFPNPDQQKEYAIMNMKDRLHSNLYIGSFTDSIGLQSDSFKAHIQNHPDSYLATEDLKFLFATHTEPLNYVVDTYQFPFPYFSIPYIYDYSYVLTMRQMADEYDQVKSIGEGLDLSLLVSRMTTSSAGIALNCGADLAGTGALSGVFSAVNSGMQWLAAASNSLSLYFVTLQEFQVVTMQNFVFPLASAIDDLHTNETTQIMNHQSPASLQNANLMVTAGDTWILSPTEISSSGTSMIVTPDGRIVEFIQKTGSYTPKSAGTYTVVSYPSSGYPLTNMAMTTFEATVPQITLVAIHSITNNHALIHTHICSQEESRAEDLSIQIIVVDTTGKPVSFDGKTFSLEGRSCLDSDFDTSLPGEGIFVVHVILAQYLLVPIDEQTFSVNSGNIIVNDAAILGIEYKPVYSAFEPVILNTTIESFSPDFTFHVKVPDMGYDEVVTLTGIDKFPLTLPPFTPGQHTLAVVAEADGKVLDARILSINVEAEGVGLVAQDQV